MFKKPIIIISFFLLAGASAFIYFYYQAPSGVVAKSDDVQLIAWIALVTSISSLITSLIGLIQKIIELRKTE
ncbi:MAG: hypothetical protein D3922_05875 [Candidatus Electrothrix sp. AR1]|nr:hypothetical protein [Candidatus Electrothrix sp. AR1]